VDIEKSHKTQSVKKEARDFERQFRVLVKNSPDVIMILDRKGTITFINYTMPEYTVESVTGTNVTSYLSPEDGRRYLQALNEVFIKNETRTLEVNSAGRTWWQVRLVPLKQEEKVESAMVIALEITDRKRVEEALKKSEYKYRLLIETTHTGYSILDLNGNVEDANLEFARLTGNKTVKEILGRNVIEWTAEYDRERNFNEVKKMLKEKVVKNLQVDYVHRDGRIIPLEIHARLIDTEKGPKILGLVRDITDRKRSEVLLKESERKFSALLSNLPGMAYRCKNDKDWTMEYVSEGCLELTGYHESDLTDHKTISFGDRVHPEDQQWLWEKCQASIAAKKLCDNEYRIITSKGETKWVWDQAHGIYSNDGELLAIEGFITDITERKQAEESIKRLSRQNRLILESAGEGIYGLDLNGNTTFANPVAAKMIGWEVDELIGKHQHSILHHSKPDGSPYPRDECPIYAAFKDGAVHHVNNEVFWRKDGTSFPVEYTSTPIRDERGKLTGAVVAFRDITERKQAEQALMESEQKYRTLFEDSRDAIYISTRDGKILGTNKFSSDLFGYPSQEMIGMNIRKIYAHPQDRLRFKKEIERKGSVKDYEVQFQKKDGTLIDCLLTSTVRKNDNGRIEGYQGIIRDISERKRYVEELIQSRERLRKLSTYLQTVREDERTRIAREIHDELGQSLTGLKMDLSSLERSLRSKIAKNKDSALFLLKVKTMFKLIDSTIQSVRRISTELRPGVLDDLGLIAAIEWQAQEFQHRTGISCKINLIPKTISMDQERATAVFRILQETLTNVARHAKATRVTINMKKLDRHVILKIHDNGKGITMKKVLEVKSFGLLGVKERAHLFGGNVEFKGIKGKGTTVTVSIPLEFSGEGTRKT
jgi:PAS domain S-box-containing protein